MPGSRAYTPQEAMKQALDKAEGPDEAISILEKHGFKLTAAQESEGSEESASPFPGLADYRKKAIDKAMPDDEEMAE